MSEQEFDIAGAAESIGADLFGSEVSGDTPNTPVTETPPATSTAPAADVTLPAKVDGEPEASPPEADTVTYKVPQTWRKEPSAEWDKLPDLVKAEITKREEDMMRGIEKYKGQASFGNEVQSAIAQYLPILQQHGINPVAQISNLMSAHYTLAFGQPQQKAELFQRIAADYGINLSELGSSESFVAPEVQQLTTQIRALESKLSRYESVQQQNETQKAQDQITSFMNDPANVYAKDLVNDMADLLQKGAAKDLADAYEKAMWINPIVRDKEVARRNAEALKTSQAKAKEAAEAAKKAASANLSTSSKDASTTAPLGTMEDTIAQTLEKIKTRKS